MKVFEMDALRIKSLMSGLYKTKNLIVRHIRHNLPDNTKVSELMVRTLPAWVVDILTVEGRVCYNQESTHLTRIIVINLLIITQVKI